MKKNENNKNTEKSAIENQLPILNSSETTSPSSKKDIIKSSSKIVTTPLKGVAKELNSKGKEFVHRKISEEEKENASLEVAHKGLREVDKTVSKSLQKKSGTQRFKRDAYEKAKKLEIEKRSESDFKKSWTDIEEGEFKLEKSKSSRNLGTKQNVSKTKDPREYRNDVRINEKNNLTYNSVSNNFSTQVPMNKVSENSSDKNRSSKLKNQSTSLRSSSKAQGSRGFIGNSLKQEVQQKVNDKLNEGAQENIALDTALKTKEWTDRPRKFLTDKGKTGVKKVGTSFSNIIKKPVRSLASQRQYRKMKKKAVYDGQKQIKEVASITKKSVKATIQLIIKSKRIGAMILLVILLFALLSACATACTGFFQGATDYLSVTTYYTEDKEIEASTLQWTDLEYKLQERIKNIETEFPEFDEYQYDVEEMVHQPLELIAYLSAMHYSFTNPEVQAEIIAIFEEVNKLTLTESVETRFDENGIPYDWKILKVELHPTAFDDVVSPKLEATGKLEQYELYKETTGNKQSLTSPVDFDWRKHISCYYGYRQDPTGAMGGGKEFHTGLDISCPTGTNVYSTQYGVVTVATTHKLYGKYIVVQGVNDMTTLYAHNSQLLVSVGDQVTPDTIIAKSGATGNVTGPHIHIEVKIGDQRVDPVFYLGTLPAGSEENEFGGNCKWHHLEKNYDLLIEKAKERQKKANTEVQELEKEKKENEISQISSLLRKHGLTIDDLELLILENVETENIQPTTVNFEEEVQEDLDGRMSIEHEDAEETVGAAWK